MHTIHTLRCVFFDISFTQQEAPLTTVRKQYITTTVAAYFIDILDQTSALILPALCDFIVDPLNSESKSVIDGMAPLKTKVIKSKLTTLWRN